MCRYRLLKACLTTLLLFIQQPLHAQEYTVTRISGEGHYNRDPVISETGMAAWMYFLTNVLNNAQSHIAIYANGERRNLTDGIANIYGAVKPQVQSNRLIFTANSRQIDGNIDWQMAEVSDRDNGEVTELSALFKATEENGEQMLIPADALSANTNDAPNSETTTTVGAGTNVARRTPSGEAEVWSWTLGDGEITRVTHDTRNDFAPCHWGNVIAWQKARGWPFGWEIMALVGNTRMQLTTNYYYDMGPKAHNGKVVWYGWDGFDYEIFLFDTATTTTVQITSNRYDDVAPVIWNDTIAWEGYSAVEADIFVWRDGTITRISDNLDDDLYPRIWENKVVWQGFDGDDFEIYAYEIGKNEKPVKLTSNGYDDTNPEIHDGLLVWMGYHENWDSEIFYLDLGKLNSGGELRPVQLTSNEEDDRDPKTAARRIIWVSDSEQETSIMLAEPK